MSQCRGYKLDEQPHQFGPFKICGNTMFRSALYPQVGIDDLLDDLNTNLDVFLKRGWPSYLVPHGDPNACLGQ